MPSVADLPPFEEAEKGLDSSIWGSPGSVEEGRAMLNLITPEVVKKAKEHIVDGVTFGLNWPLTMLDHTSFGRLPFKHEIVAIQGFPNCLDDEYHMNPQSGSQWDGLRHWSDTKTGLFYGGQSMDEAKDGKNHRMGVGKWSGSGIVGRGVLLDYARYAEKKGIKYEAFGGHPVSADALKDMAKENGITFEAGDILLIRFGYTKAWESFSDEKRKELATSAGGASVGLEQSEAVCRFLYDNHFSAVVGDNIGLETVPFGDMDWSIHDHLLARWGVPIGEMWYLDDLAAHCAKTGRYTFFLSSAPFSAPAGISSVPNCVAVV